MANVAGTGPCLILSLNKKLEIIPKLENYVQYMLEIILKLPRTEKFSIGNEYKKSMYETIENILYIEKIDKLC